MATLESHLVADILNTFGKRPDLRLWRQNTGAARDKTGRLIRFGVPGAADISGIWRREIEEHQGDGWDPAWTPYGIRIEIECKSPTGTQTEAQRNWQRMIESMGGVYILARSLDDVREVLGDG